MDVAESCSRGPSPPRRKEVPVPGPFLLGKRVQLRPFEDEDAPILADWINDPEIRKLVLSRFAKSVKDEREWLATMSAKETPPRNIVFGVELKRDRKLIGSIGLHTIDWVQRRAMTGILIYPTAFRGKGYGTEAKNLMLDYAFGELGMLSLWALAIEGNEASIRGLEKQGYKRSGVFRKSTLVQGVWVDSIYFDILREEWEELRGGGRRRRTGR
jgi:RimJ/RimL family protein N-acetyltransferase